MDSRVVYQKGKPQGNRRNLEEHDVSEYDENEHEHNLDGADVVYDEEIDPRDSNLKEQPGRGSGRSVPREDGNKYSSNGQVSNNQNSRLKKPNDFIISSKAKKNGIKTIEELKKQLYINNNAMKKKYNDTYQENVQLKTKLSQMKKEIDKMDKLIKQGSKNYQKNAHNDFQDLVDDDENPGPSLKTLWQRKKMIKDIRAEIEKLEAETKETKQNVQNFKPAQAEAQLDLLVRNLEYYRSKIQHLESQQARDGQFAEENENLRKEEVELAHMNNELIKERDSLRQEVKRVQDRNREIEQKEKELPKLTQRKKNLQKEVEDLRQKAEGSLSKEVIGMLEDLRKLNEELREKAERFERLKEENLYTLKNIALSFQKSNKKHADLAQAVASLEPNVEKRSFQALLEKDPFNLKNGYSQKAADLLFLDGKSIEKHRLAAMLVNNVPKYLTHERSAFEKYKNEAREFLKEPKATKLVEEFTAEGNKFPFDHIEKNLLKKILKNEEQREAIFVFLFQHGADSKAFDVSLLLAEFCQRHPQAASDQKKQLNIRPGREKENRQVFDEEVNFEQDRPDRQNQQPNEKAQKALAEEKRAQELQEKQRKQEDLKKKELEDLKKKELEDLKKKEEEAARKKKQEEEEREKQRLRQLEEQKRLEREAEEKKRQQAQAEAEAEKKRQQELREQEEAAIKIQALQRQKLAKREVDQLKKEKEERERLEREKKAEEARRQKEKDEAERRRLEEEARRKRQEEERLQEEERERKLLQEMQNQKKPSKANAKQIEDFLDDFENEPMVVGDIDTPKKKQKKAAPEELEPMLSEREPKQATAAKQPHPKQKPVEDDFFYDEFDRDPTGKAKATKASKAADPEDEMKRMLEDPDMDKAATKIQAVYKGKKDRAKVSELKQDRSKNSGNSKRTDEEDLGPMLKNDESLKKEEEESLKKLVEDPEMDLAASKIQAAYKGKKDRQKVQEMKKDRKNLTRPAINIEKPLEDEPSDPFQDRHRADNEEEQAELKRLSEDPDVDKAAVKIQAVYRGKQQRAQVEELKKQKKSQVVEPEKPKAPKKPEEPKKSEDDFFDDFEDSKQGQAAQNSKQEQDELKRLSEDPDVDKAAVKIQAVYRGKKDRAAVEEKKKEAKKGDKAEPAVAKPKSEDFDDDFGASKGKQAQEEDELKRLVEDPDMDKAAVKIQAVYKGKKDRAKVDELKKSKANQQPEPVAKPAPKKEDKLDEDIQKIMDDPGVDNAAIKIQSAFRGKKEREKVEELKKERQNAPPAHTQPANPSAGQKDDFLENPAPPVNDKKVAVITDEPDEFGAIDDIIKDQKSDRKTAGKSSARDFNKDSSRTKLREPEPEPNPDEEIKQEDELQEILNDPNVDQAATKIQATFKGKKDRERVEQLKKQKEEEKQKQLQAEKKRQQEAELRRVEEEEQAKAAVRIQAVYRGKNDRARVEDLKKQNQASPQPAERAAPEPQKKPAEPERDLEQEKAAVKIQASFRGKQDRKKVDELKTQKRERKDLEKITVSQAEVLGAEHDLAAARIQAHYRGKKDREKVEQLKKSRQGDAAAADPQQPSEQAPVDDGLLAQDRDQLSDIENLQGTLSVQLNQLFFKKEPLESVEGFEACVLMKAGKNTFRTDRLKQIKAENLVDGYFEFHREEETAITVRVNCYQDTEEGEAKMNFGEAKIVLSDYISASGIDTPIRLPLFIPDDFNQPYETGLLTAQLVWTPDPIPDDYESPNFADHEDQF